MRIHTKIRMIENIWLIWQDQPAVFLQNVHFIRNRKWHGFFLLLREFFLEFSISLAVLFKKQPDVIINFSDDPTPQSFLYQASAQFFGMHVCENTRHISDRYYYSVLHLPQWSPHRICCTYEEVLPALPVWKRVLHCGSVFWKQFLSFWTCYPISWSSVRLHPLNKFNVRISGQKIRVLQNFILIIYICIFRIAAWVNFCLVAPFTIPSTL